MSSRASRAHRLLLFPLIGRVDRDDCYHDEDGESIDEDVINEIRTVYDEILEKKVPTYPYENYPDVSLGEFIRTEFEQYLQSKKSALDESEIAQREKVIDWLDKQHPFLDALGCQRLTDVSVQGKRHAHQRVASLASLFHHRMDFLRTLASK